jgi:isopenicillin-N epimerase
LVVSWGYKSDPGFGSGNQFIDYHEWQGTRDLAAFLSVPAAIEYMAHNQWDEVRADCHQLAAYARLEVNALASLTSICPEGKDWFGQMVAIRLPDVDTKGLQTELYDRYQIEVPLMRWQGQPLIRVSIQEYNTQADVEKLMRGLANLL